MMKVSRTVLSYDMEDEIENEEVAADNYLTAAAIVGAGMDIINTIEEGGEDVDWVFMMIRALAGARLRHMDREDE